MLNAGKTPIFLAVHNLLPVRHYLSANKNKKGGNPRLFYGNNNGV